MFMLLHHQYLLYAVHEFDCGSAALPCGPGTCLQTVHRFCCSNPAGIAIGGDVFPGSTLSDHCCRYQNIKDIKMIVVLGELGGTDEYSLVTSLRTTIWTNATCCAGPLCYASIMGAELNAFH
jgi:hypothetical protein